ncbi:dihydrodipicolinate synthase family protein [Pinibacter soli]|nr:dihydrodipicolinate synthase family protein [Pinibacter soli]
MNEKNEYPAGKKYAGIVVPMITPLTKELQPDVEAVKKIMLQFAQNNISPLVLGTTGESPSIGKKESEMFVATAVQCKQGNQIIYAGLVGNNFAEVIESAKCYAGLGADVVVATLPSYYTLTPAQMENFYLQLAEQSPCPVMMYNIKATTQMTIPLDVVARLSKHPNIKGLKDSERDPERLKECIDTYKNNKDFSFFCGWGAQGFSSLAMGADGIVPSTGNIVPELYKKMYDAFVSQNFDAAKKYQQETDDIAVLYQKDRTLGQSLAALKLMMHARNMCQPYMMPPLTELSAEEKNDFELKMDDLKLSVV